jgi:hypothetical protein
MSESGETPEIRKEHALETYKSLIQISIECIKLLALLNGGASVALLAYLGNIAGKNWEVPDMRWPMGLYLFGLFCCGITFVASYCTQLALYNESMGRPFTKHECLLRWAIASAFLSIISFAVGSFLSVVKFK